MSLKSLGLPDGARPLDVSATTGSKNLASVSFATPDGSRRVLSVTSEGGKLKSANVVESKEDGAGVSLLAGCKNTDGNLVVRQRCSDERCSEFSSTLEVTPLSRSGGDSLQVKLPFAVSRLEEAWAVCEDGGAFRIFAMTSDGTLAAADSKRGLLWTRDEALADITAVQMIAPAADDDEMEDDDGAGVGAGDAANHVLEQFVRRIRRHLSQLFHLGTRLAEARDLAQLIIGDQDSRLDSTFFIIIIKKYETKHHTSRFYSYDDFGFRKIVVAVAANLGKVVGMDSKSGDILWKLNYQGGDEDVKLFVQRGTAHFGLDPR